MPISSHSSCSRNENVTNSRTSGCARDSGGIWRKSAWSVNRSAKVLVGSSHASSWRGGGINCSFICKYRIITLYCPIDNVRYDRYVLYQEELLATQRMNRVPHP